MARSANKTLQKGSGVLGDIVLNQIDGHTVMKSRSVETEIKSPKVIAQTDTFAEIAALWMEQDRESRSAWWALGQQMTDPEDKRIRQTLTAYQAFQSVQTGLYAQGNPYNPVALAAPVAPAALPIIGMEATLTTGSSPVFQLRLLSPAYAQAVQIFAQAPLYSTQAIDRTAGWRLLETDGNIPAGGMAIGTSFLSVFGKPSLTDKIVVKVVAISPEGFRSKGRVIWTNVAPPPIEATDTDDETGDGQQKAA